MEKSQASYQCSECGLHYKDAATTESCRAWCKKYKSCNLDITKQSLESVRRRLHLSKSGTNAELIFVYNAKSGLGNALLDTGRRITQPKDYPCALCMITYGPFGMKKSWNAFIRTLPYKVRFLHKDELVKILPDIEFSPPGLILVAGKKHTTLLDAEDFNDIKSLDALKLKVTGLL